MGFTWEKGKQSRCLGLATGGSWSLPLAGPAPHAECPTAPAAARVRVCAGNVPAAGGGSAVQLQARHRCARLPAAATFESLAWCGPGAPAKKQVVGPSPICACWGMATAFHTRCSFVRLDASLHHSQICMCLPRPRPRRTPWTSAATAPNSQLFPLMGEAMHTGCWRCRCGGGTAVQRMCSACGGSANTRMQPLPQPPPLGSLAPLQQGARVPICHRQAEPRIRRELGSGQ